MKSLTKRLRALLVAASALAISSCASTGGPFGISDEQGRALGDQEHPKIVAAFGGEMNDPELFAYIDGITRKLMAVSDQPDEPVKVTLLDSPVINAMALPGHVYVTRGLVTLANSEAELAGVIGHELGHIYKRHTAKRVSRGNMATLGSVLVGILTRNPGMMQTAGQAAQLYLLQFSREQEYESDSVGVVLLARSGYDPAGAAEFLDQLDDYSKLESQISGQQAAPPEFLSTHPNTAERVRRAAAEAQAVPRTGALNAENSRAQYLAKIDGLIYGDDPVKQGFIRGNEFFHPEMGIAFGVPNGFKLQNTSTAVIATGQNAQMQFTGANSNEPPTTIIQQLSQQLGVQFQNVRQFNLGGRQGATAYGQAQTQSGQTVDVQPFVVKWAGATNYLFLWVSAPNATQSLQNSIEQSVSSLREVNPATLSVPPTRKVDVVRVGGGDTLASLSQQSQFEDYRRERFCVLNGLDTCDAVTIGEAVKVIR
jgi:predicted Zn-dependent protease